MTVPIITGPYDPVLVVLSLAVSIAGFYTALDLAERARTASRFGASWLMGASLAMASSIWAMHFVGTLAFSLDMTASFDPAIAALSLAASVLFTGAALFAVVYLRARPLVISSAGMAMGIGIALMHYLDLEMSGISITDWIENNPWRTVLSSAIAVAASMAALWLVVHVRRERLKILGAAVVGLAVVSVHYIGMPAPSFIPAATLASPPDLQPQLLAMAVTLATFVLLFLGRLSSLSDRRLAAEQRAEHEAAYHAVVDSAADAILVIDEDGIIRSFNRAAETVFGYNAAAAMGKPVEVLLPGPGQGRRKDGSLFPLESSAAEWSVGNKRYVTNILRDITKRKQDEADLSRAKDEAEHAVQAKAKFLAAASHDLRQPVQSLFFFASALGMRLNGHPAASVVASMNESLAALKMLLDGLLDISRLDAGVVEPNSTPFAVDTLLQRLRGEYSLQAAEQGLELRVVGSSAWTRSDPILLERILRNLVENALRYTPQGKILLGCRRSGGKLRIEVWDTGIGIPGGKIEYLFEEFYQIGNSERDRRQGLGLGLAIVRRLSELLGHRVTVRSRLDHGSVFAIELPCVKAQPLAPACPGSVANDEGQGLIVVIDDENILLLSMRAMLENWGYEVVAASSGAEALELLDGDGRAPDTIIADYRLRDGHTGTQAIRDIRGLCGVRIPAIVLTGDTAPERIAEAEHSGFTILHKPVSPPDLKRLLGGQG